MSDALVKRLLTQAGVAVLAGVLSSSAVWAEDDASVSGESAVEATDPSTGDTGVASEPAETQEDVSDAGDNPQVSEEPDVTIDPPYEPEIAICPVEWEGPELVVDPVEETGVTIDVVEEPEVAVDPEDNSDDAEEPVEETLTEGTPEEVVDPNEEPQVAIDPPFEGEEPILVIDPVPSIDPIFVTYETEDGVYYMATATGGEVVVTVAEEETDDNGVPQPVDDSGMIPDVQTTAETVGAEPVLARSGSDHSDPAPFCAQTTGKDATCDAAMN